MKYLIVVLFLIVSLNFTAAFAADQSADSSPSSMGEELIQKCNLEARNALVNGDLALVEKVCTQAIKELDKSNSNREYVINPMLNLAFSYTLAGKFDKAEPYYSRAKSIGEKLYEPGSGKLEAINEVIKTHEEMKKHYRNN